MMIKDKMLLKISKETLEILNKSHLFNMRIKRKKFSYEIHINRKVLLVRKKFKNKRRAINYKNKIRNKENMEVRLVEYCHGKIKTVIYPCAVERINFNLVVDEYAKYNKRTII